MKLVMDADLVCKIVVRGGHLDSVPCALHRLPGICGPQWAVCVSWNSPITPVRGQTLREGALWSTLEEAYSS